VGDPLGLNLRSLKNIAVQIPADVLILPGHQLPFHGLHIRCQQLSGHHIERCKLIAAACKQKPHSIADLVSVIFSRLLDPHEMGFAFSEVHAHVNFILRQGQSTLEYRSCGLNTHDYGRRSRMLGDKIAMVTGGATTIGRAASQKFSDARATT
jgi:hypothetical protein